MNKHTFTLTELLIAIGIIVILAAMVIPVVSGAIKKAETAKAQAEMTTLVNALKNYESTYGTLIKLLRQGGFTVDGTMSTDGKLDGNEDTYKDNYSKLIEILQGKKSVIVAGTEVKLNPRGIKFLDVQENTEGQFLDPWDNPYYIVFDIDGDGKIDTTKCCPYGLDVDGDTIRKEFVIWSKGPDGEHDKDVNKKENADNVFSIPATYDKQEKAWFISK